MSLAFDIRHSAYSTVSIYDPRVDATFLLWLMSKVPLESTYGLVFEDHKTYLDGYRRRPPVRLHGSDWRVQIWPRRKGHACRVFSVNVHDDRLLSATVYGEAAYVKVFNEHAWTRDLTLARTFDLIPNHSIAQNVPAAA